MSETVIRVENLSQKYIFGHQKQGKYVSLRDEIVSGTKSVWNKLTYLNQKQPDRYHEEFWALKDVSFEI
jgi:lipopolysaccharide transport system ATP-binding protein